MKKYISSLSLILILTLCDGKVTDNKKKIPKSKIHSKLFNIFPQVGKKNCYRRCNVRLCWELPRAISRKF